MQLVSQKKIPNNTAKDLFEDVYSSFCQVNDMKTDENSSTRGLLLLKFSHVTINY